MYVAAGALQVLFQSTLPAGGATQIDKDKALGVNISIHAPRRGSDRCRTRCYNVFRNFNPRSPQGERRDKKEVYLDAYKFQSTLPAGGATHSIWRYSIHVKFQSTLPAGEATYLHQHNRRPHSYFNPRSPQGKRHYQL